MERIIAEVHVGLAALDVLLVVSAALATFVGGSRTGAKALLVTSAAWLPLNNHLLEGPILLGVGDRHGLTVSDLFGVAGVALAALRVWAPRGERVWPWLWRYGARVSAVVLAGLVVAAGVTSSHILETPAPHRGHHHHAQEAAFELRGT